MTELASGGGSIAYSSYLGGNADERGYGIAVDANYSARIVGSTASSNFPTSAAFQSSNNGGTDAFIANVGDAPLVLSPASASVPPKGSQGFAASGGSGGYVYAFQTNASGGSINSMTGAYIAGPSGSVSDVVPTASIHHVRRPYMITDA